MTKPLLTITLSKRSYDGTISPLQVIEVSQLGNLNLVIGFDEINEPKVELAEVTPSKDFIETVQESYLTLREAHEAMARAQIAFQHASTDMFAVKRYIDPGVVKDCDCAIKQASKR